MHGINMVRWLIGAALALVLALGPSVGDRAVLAQTSGDPPAGDPPERVITIVAEALAQEPDHVDVFLARLGFPPPDWPMEAWRDYPRWSSIAKLELAYLAAEEADRGRGGKALLRDFARLVAAERYYSIRYEPALKDFFPEKPDDPITAPEPKQRAFKALPPGMGRAKLPRQARAIIAAIAPYTGPHPLGHVALFHKCCGLAEEKAYELLRQQQSLEAAIELAVERGQLPPEKAKRLKALVRLVTEYSSAALLEQVFREFPDWGKYLLDSKQLAAVAPAVAKDIELKAGTGGEASLEAMVSAALAEAERTAQATAPSHGAMVLKAAAAKAAAAKPEASEGTLHDPLGAADYANFYDASYPSGSGASGGGAAGGGGAAPSFQTMTRGGGGFGGVVFGSPVTSKLPPPTSVEWVERTPPTDATGGEIRSGFLRFSFKDRSSGFSPLLRADHVLIARQILVEGLGDRFAPLTKEGGVGLAGVVVQPPRPRWLAIDEETHRVTQENIASGGFFIHPALSGTSLNRAVMVVDLLPNLLRDKVALAPSEEKQAMERWLGSDLGFYKFTDVPTRIVREPSGLLYVERQPKPKTTETSPGLRRSALLRMQTFRKHYTYHSTPLGYRIESRSEPRSEDEDDALFYGLVPALVRTVPEMRELNDFARAFAFVRWAAANKLPWRRTPEAPDRGPALASLLIMNELPRVRVAPPAAELERDFIARVRERSAALARQGRVSGPVLNKAKKAADTRMEGLATALAARLACKADTSVPNDVRDKLMNRLTSLRDGDPFLAEKATEFNKQALPIYWLNHDAARLFWPWAKEAASTC